MIGEGMIQKHGAAAGNREDLPHALLREPIRYTFGGVQSKRLSSIKSIAGLSHASES
jgi:hypothetical protein